VSSLFSSLQREPRHSLSPILRPSSEFLSVSQLATSADPGRHSHLRPSAMRLCLRPTKGESKQSATVMKTLRHSDISPAMSRKGRASEFAQGDPTSAKKRFETQRLAGATRERADAGFAQPA
jgi:hypothetical protein